MNKLAEEFSKKILARLLESAMAANKGHGINVLYEGRHYGWYRWNGSSHEKFSIDDLKDKTPVGKLEDIVGDLKVINLEDYS